MTVQYLTFIGRKYMSSTRPCAIKIVISSDTEKVNAIRKALQDNEGYCPCEIHKTPDTKCMCKAFRMQTFPGPCHCGLYEKQLKEENNNG